MWYNFFLNIQIRTCNNKHKTTALFKVSYQNHTKYTLTRDDDHYYSRNNSSSGTVANTEFILLANFLTNDSLIVDFIVLKMTLKFEFIMPFDINPKCDKLASPLNNNKEKNKN
jgi:hypothetical protein